VTELPDCVSTHVTSSGPNESEPAPVHVPVTLIETGGVTGGGAGVGDAGDAPHAASAAQTSTWVTAAAMALIPTEYKSSRRLTPCDDRLRIFSVVCGVLLRPLRCREPSRLVRMTRKDSTEVSGSTSSVSGSYASADSFDVVGGSLSLGRFFDQHDSHSPVAVISHRLWQREFNADP
jgi:hypothetical protein